MSEHSSQVVTLPTRGPRAGDLHGHFQRSLEAYEAIRGGFDREAREIARGKCALFAGRLLRTPAHSIPEILLKLEAFDWLEADAQQVLELIRADLQHIASVP